MVGNTVTVGCATVISCSAANSEAVAVVIGIVAGDAAAKGDVAVACVVRVGNAVTVCCAVVASCPFEASDEATGNGNVVACVVAAPVANGVVTVACVVVDRPSVSQFTCALVDRPRPRTRAP